MNSSGKEVHAWIGGAPTFNPVGSSVFCVGGSSIMCDNGKFPAHEAAIEACRCCNEIACALDHAIKEATQLCDRDMLEQLSAAKKTTDHARELIGKLADMLARDETR